MNLATELRGVQIRLGGIGESWLFLQIDGKTPWSREIFDQQLNCGEACWAQTRSTAVSGIRFESNGQRSAST